MATFSKRSLDNLIGVHPDLIRLMKEAVKDTPVDFTIVQGVRTAAEQKALYAKGRTAPGPKVTNLDGYRKKSNHQPKDDGYGYAVDLYPFVNGSVQVNYPNVLNWQKQIANHIKVVANQLGITIVWGGDWKAPFDPPHFELKRKP